MTTELKALGKKLPTFETHNEFNVMENYYRQALLEAADELLSACCCDCNLPQNKEETLCFTCDLAKKIKISAGVEE